jgi:hypothetical protein
MNEETARKDDLTVVRLKDNELVDHLCLRSRQSILAWIRERNDFVFWHAGESEVLNYFSLGRFLGISRSEKLNLQSVAKVLNHYSPMAFRTFEANWYGGDGSNPTVDVKLTGVSEWDDVLNEAWEGLERPPYNLSEPAGKLLKWLQLEANQNIWIHRSNIGRQAKLRGTGWSAELIAGIFKEIQRKSNLGIKVEQRDDEFRLSFGPENEIEQMQRRHGPLNPVLNLDLKQVKFAELDRFRETLYGWIMAAELPGDSAPLAIWLIHDRATLAHCFPAWRQNAWEISTLVNFLSEIALDYGLLWGYSFQDPDPWRFECCPKQGLKWTDVKSSIHKARQLPPLIERYGISPEAAALVKWFTTLKPKEWFVNLTPAIEEHLEKRIGISTKWSAENLDVFFTMLANEITDRTEWTATVHAWKNRWGGATHRLLVKRKQTALEDVVLGIQMFAIKQGKLVPKDKVASTLSALLESS